MLDPSTAVELLRGPRPALAGRMSIEPPGSGLISSIAVAELWYGVHRSREAARNGDAVARLLESLEVVRFGSSAAEVDGVLRTDLGKRGQSIGPLDTLIAAHALSLEALLVTANVGEFSRVPGLHLGVGGWQRPTP